MSAPRRPVRRLPAFVTLVAGATLGAPASARAQDAHAQDAHAPDAGLRDSLPARAGTYALEGGVGVNSTSFGVLRFLSPRSAVGAMLAASYSHTSGDNGTSNDAGVSATLGYRRYGRLRDRVAGFGTVGLTAGYSHQAQTSQQTYPSKTSYNDASVGGFGELGAAYLVVPRLTVNASASATLTGRFSRITNDRTTPTGMVTFRSRQNGFGAGLGPVRFGLTLFL